MAGPLATLGIQLAKTVIVDLVTEPEKVLKYGGIGCLSVLAFLIVILMPLILLFMVPTILLNSQNVDGKLTDEQMRVIGVYENAPILVHKDNLKWIEMKKREMSDCDEFIIEIQDDVSWQILMSINAVQREQTYDKVSDDQLLALALNFMKREARKEVHGGDNDDGDDEVIPGQKRGRRQRTIGIITISTREVEEVLNILHMNAEKKEQVYRFFGTIDGYDTEGNLNIYDDLNSTDLKEYPPGSSNLPYFNQADKRWGGYSYGRSTIKSGGCGPTALAMVVSGLTRRSDINPKIVADWSASNGHRAEGLGSYWSLMTEGGRNYGLNVQAISRKDPNMIMSSLSNGYPIIVAMGRGHFTRTGHFIVLSGLTADGKIRVYDPSSIERSNKTWDLGIILSESSTNSGVNGSPFWCFKF